MGGIRITKEAVEALSPGSSDVYLWDAKLKGYGLKVTPSGRRVYFVQYRLGGRNGRTRRVTIGTHGVKTEHQARSEAKALLGAVQAGNDPAAQRDKLRQAETLGRALDRFLAAHVDPKCRAYTAQEYKRVLRLHVPTNLRSRNITDVNRGDITRLHDGLKDKPFQANRVLAILSKFFNWCEAQGIRPDHSNPCRHVEKFRTKGRERFLSAEELRQLGVALAQAESDGSASPWMIAAIRLLAFTGARLSEILTLRWDYVDLAGHQIRLPESKTGRKSIYLNPPALEVLANVPRLDGNPFVICGEREGAHLVNLQKPWRRIRKVAGLDDVRIHDLRHTFASWGAMGGLPLPIIGGLLSHSQPQTTQRYAHLAADPLKAATERVANALAGAMGNGRSAAVVPLRKAAEGK
jgi:integrase